MGEFLFGVGVGRVSRERAKQIDAVAKQHGACFVEAEGRHWFSTENLGEPFDSATAEAVYAALAEAGLDPIVPETASDRRAREEAKARENRNLPHYDVGPPWRHRRIA